MALINDALSKNDFAELVVQLNDDQDDQISLEEHGKLDDALDAVLDASDRRDTDFLSRLHDYRNFDRQFRFFNGGEGTDEAWNAFQVLQNPESTDEERLGAIDKMNYISGPQYGAYAEVLVPIIQNPEENLDLRLAMISEAISESRSQDVQNLLFPVLADMLYDKNTVPELRNAVLEKLLLNSYSLSEVYTSYGMYQKVETRAERMMSPGADIETTTHGTVLIQDALIEIVTDKTEEIGFRKQALTLLGKLNIFNFENPELTAIIYDVHDDFKLRVQIFDGIFDIDTHGGACYSKIKSREIATDPKLDASMRHYLFQHAERRVEESKQKMLEMTQVGNMSHNHDDAIIWMIEYMDRSNCWKQTEPYVPSEPK